MKIADFRCGVGAMTRTLGELTGPTGFGDRHRRARTAAARSASDVLRPGGLIVVEDGDLASATSIPPSAMDAFADLFCRLGPTRGLDYSVARDLYHMVIQAGFVGVDIELHQPAITRGENRATPSSGASRKPDPRLSRLASPRPRSWIRRCRTCRTPPTIRPCSSLRRRCRSSGDTKPRDSRLWLECWHEDSLPCARIRRVRRH